MPQQRNRVSDMDFDEVSTVDIPANQHGLIVLAKSASQEDIVADFADEQGNPIEGQLVQDEAGDVFLQTEDGDLYSVDPDDLGEDVYDGTEERELEAVGKSAFLEELDDDAEGFYGYMSDELAKALNDAGRDDVLAKAFAAQRAELAKAQAETDRALEIAKAVQDREQTNLFISKAAEDYGHTGVDPEVLGPVLKRMSESLSYEDCAVVAGILDRQGDIFKQFGVPGGEEIYSPLDEIEAYANEHGDELAKSYGHGEGRTTLSKEQSAVAFFDANPGAYSQIKRGQY